jgi:integrase
MLPQHKLPAAHRRGTLMAKVSQLLGHSSPVITLSTYAHVIEGVAREAVNVPASSLIRRPTGTGGV